MKLLALTLALALSGCSAIESRQYLHALKTDPDCSYRDKPMIYNMPDKCGMKNYGGSTISVIRISPNTLVVNK